MNISFRKHRLILLQDTVHTYINMYACKETENKPATSAVFSRKKIINV